MVTVRAVLWPGELIRISTRLVKPKCLVVLLEMTNFAKKQ